MDQDKEIMDELGRLQSNITTLFRCLINAKKESKEEKENSSTTVQSLMTEIISLRNENERLKRCNNVGSSCTTCSELREQLKIHDARSRKLEKILDFFRKMVYNGPYQDGNPHLSKLACKCDELKSDNQEECMEISQRLNSISDEIDKHKKEDIFILNKTSADKIEERNSKEFHETTEQREANQERKKNHDSPIIETHDEESYLDINFSDTNSKIRSEKMIVEFSTPKKGDNTVDFISSSFCSNFGIKKGETSPILVDRRFMINKNSFSGSPSYLKRKAGETSSISPAKFKNITLFPKSPKQKKYKSGKESQTKLTSQLKNSNYLDVEISFAGIRKLKQTQLNPDYYVCKTQDNGDVIRNNLNENSNEENKSGEDDVILESPKRSGKLFVDLKNTLRSDEFERMKTSSEVEHSEGADREVFDPEETFVSSSLIRNSVNELNIKEELVPAERERSPEYNTVPNIYKGSPVRKRAERMLLPGQTCMECNEYYKAVLGEIDPKRLQDILNQCSRHRNHHYNVADTPPGYWKPYLTASMDNSRWEDDGTSNE